MEVPDLISKEVWDIAAKAFQQHEHFVAYNNTLLFVHEEDIRFFTNEYDAQEFAYENGTDHDKWQVVRISTLDEFKQHVEGIVPGLVYKPVEEAAVVNEPQQNYFPKQELIQKSKVIMENTENQEYLQNQLKFLGFDEGLYPQLEKKMKEGAQEFTLDASTTFGKDQMSAVINFKAGERDGKTNYFCNSYIATLQKDDKALSQFFYVNNKGQSITFKESFNLLNVRAVHKELTPKQGQPYKAWGVIDPTKIDPKTGYPSMRWYGAVHGFDLKEAVGRMPFKELQNGDDLKMMLKSLEKGNLRPSTLINAEGQEQKVFVAANPQQKTLNMYDKDMNRLDYPLEKVALKYGQAPADQKKEDALAVAEPQQAYGKADLLKKNKPDNGLLKKNNARKSTGRKLTK